MNAPGSAGGYLHITSVHFRVAATIYSVVTACALFAAWAINQFVDRIEKIKWLRNTCLIVFSVCLVGLYVLNMWIEKEKSANSLQWIKLSDSVKHAHFQPEYVFLFVSFIWGALFIFPMFELVKKEKAYGRSMHFLGGICCLLAAIGLYAVFLFSESQISVSSGGLRPESGTVILSAGAVSLVQDCLVEPKAIELSDKRLVEKGVLMLPEIKSADGYWVSLKDLPIVDRNSTDTYLECLVNKRIYSIPNNQFLGQSLSASAR